MSPLNVTEAAWWAHPDRYRFALEVIWSDPGIHNAAHYCGDPDSVEDRGNPDCEVLQAIDAFIRYTVTGEHPHDTAACLALPPGTGCTCYCGLVTGLVARWLDRINPKGYNFKGLPDRAVPPVDALLQGAAA